MLPGVRFFYVVAVSWKCDFEQPSIKNARFFIFGRLFFSSFWLPFSGWFPRVLLRRSFSRFWEDLGAKLASKNLPKTFKNRFQSQRFLKDFSKALKSQLKRKKDANGSQNRVCYPLLDRRFTSWLKSFDLANAQQLQSPMAKAIERFPSSSPRRPKMQPR